MTPSSLVRPPAPLLAVVGGPTGAGKSTLVNSLVRAPVSPVGVLRPTTRQPVLICNPADSASVHRHGLRPIAAPLLPAGISIIDAPDIDSIEEANRALADELFDDADLWLFVTTATRYADAAAWRHLRAARERQVALAVVLDRVPVDSASDIIDHLRELLGEPEPPLFVVPESILDRQGMLPEQVVAPLRAWLAAVVAGPPVQEEVAPPAREEAEPAAWNAFRPAPSEADPAAQSEAEPAAQDEAEPAAEAERPGQDEAALATQGNADQPEAVEPRAENEAEPSASAEATSGDDVAAETIDPVEATAEPTVADGDDEAAESVEGRTGLDAETAVGETMQGKSRPTPQPVGAGRPSEGPPTDPGGQA